MNKTMKMTSSSGTYNTIYNIVIFYFDRYNGKVLRFHLNKTCCKHKLVIDSKFVAAIYNVILFGTETYSELCQTHKVEHFAKIVNG